MYDAIFALLVERLFTSSLCFLERRLAVDWVLPSSPVGFFFMAAQPQVRLRSVCVKLTSTMSKIATAALLASLDTPSYVS